MKRWDCVIQESHTQLVAYTFAIEAESRTEAEAQARAMVRQGKHTPARRGPVRKQLLTANVAEQPVQEVLDA